MSSNRRAVLGYGVANAVSGNESVALTSWQMGEVDPRLLIGFGDIAKSRGLLDRTLIYYRGAEALEFVRRNEGKFLIGRVCQRALARPELLSTHNQHYCRSYFTQNDGNLLLNGQFSEDGTWGWQGQLFFSNAASAFRINDITGKPAPSLQYIGLRSGQQNGLYQTISLQPGSRVRFGGWFQIKEGESIKARLLYVGWRQNDESQGNQLQVMSGEDMEWTYLERTFRLPENSELNVRFFPVLFIGEGQILVDDVSVQLMP